MRNSAIDNGPTRPETDRGPETKQDGALAEPRTLVLEVLDGPLKGKRIGLSSGVSYIGCSPASVLTLEEPGLAERQLRIEWFGNSVRVTNLGDTCTTWIGRFRLGEALFELGQPCQLQVGETRLRLSEARGERQEEREGLGRLVGQSPQMHELYSRIRRIAGGNATVLLEGETGTGKELIVEELHRGSCRANGPFVVVDCASVPGTLIESELFGHCQGSFTGATRDRAGAFERANGGTIFLDEVGELEPSLQPRLLRVLEAREVKRIGDSRYRPIDVRVVAATHRSLRRAVERGEFRADLFYRLAVVHLKVPPLRERVGDLELLVESLLPSIALELGRPAPPVTPEVLAAIRSYGWPGNVRELRNYLERAVVYGFGAIPGDNRRVEQPHASARAASPAGSGAAGPDQLPQFRDAKAACVSHFEGDYLKQLLSLCRDNVSEAARRSGLARSHLFRLLHKHGMR